ncbi:ABC transporter substrate-binding protein [Paenibacillus chungangensis]|uniref:ABC transporter substrate-binding protein n=1 Tax=Paenibacillus chungangensis TaxID=696535 RepID=A0ABW3HQB4_9BACL
MRKWSVASLVVVLMLGVMLTGCGGNNGGDEGEKPKDGAADSKKSITLNIAAWGDRYRGVLEQSIERFNEKHEHVTVNITFTPFKDYWTKMQTSIAGNNGPDILWMNGPNFMNFASLGLVENLQPYIEKDSFDMNAYPEGIVNLYSYNDQQYGLPYFLGPMGLYYNKEILDKHNVPYPDETWTWETVEEYGEQLTDKENQVYGYIVANSGQAGYYPLIHQAGGFVINPERTQSGIASAETQKALTWMKTLMDKGISPDAQSQLENNMSQMFGSGHSAMLVDGSFAYTTLSKMLGDKLGVAVLPHDVNKGYMIHGTSWVINSRSEHKDEAWELLKILAGQEGAEISARSGINYPAYNDAVDIWAGTMPKDHVEAFKQGLEEAVPYPISVKSSEWEKVLDQEITDALLGKKSVQEAAESAGQRMDEIISKEKRN